MSVESRSAGAPSHRLPALELQLVSSTVPISKKGSKEGKPIHCELQSGADRVGQSQEHPGLLISPAGYRKPTGGCPRLSRITQ